ncbi:hypothetical protein M2459_000090 [Parabacteroides sp. PF5-5]|uniref:TonB-dependent receptor n=1 Tax=unclassified Parabacteroides TaxID=2649774 RepID=UPI0024734C05|nr:MULTISPECIES: TonB-dependent receptor plug domain-containing protein [unclassified Parabacteroides]MDH6303758.1 hypothetical protein [Parabacteroides sp. PH5-39]MDH6314375.1 hypothetical protein [Parabacteroides sp. PF5-13]MDH6318560.1 hypothetical protein [Parabacteroides sp. PH5-13]MDH6322147.1 hypothetical protein [Parabacteroides sp. PH5-8]MDH6325773.1 hypothetical protein [Parabacteroides sp. PH5-41]
MKPLVISILLLAMWQASLGQTKNTLVSDVDVQNQIASQLANYPQEKLHLHVDRNHYVPGENIWFKAYPVDALSHLSPTKSRYVYVELISPADTLISRVKIRPQDGMYHGHIFLSDIVPEGEYTLRAYTRYMENLGSEYFYRKKIYIGSLSADTEQERKAKKKKASRLKDDYDVSFFPEGGNLLAGTLCKVAFKAMNRNGYSEYITGEVVNEAGDMMALIKSHHAGVGVFSFIPASGGKYYLNCVNDKGLSKRIELPEAKSGARSLLTYWRNDRLFISKQQSFDMQLDLPTYLLVQSRGVVLYFGAWDKHKSYISFTQEQLPPGVIQAILFDDQMNPLSERLVFSKNVQMETAKLDIQTDKTSYQTREQITSTIRVSDQDDLSLLGNISVSVTDDKDITIDPYESILTSLLLTSELKGYIESPGYYFEEDTDKRNLELDYLMMVHGWKRYNIPEVLKGTINQPEIPFEEGDILSGSVKSLFRAKPVPNSEVSVITSSGEFGLAQTDENGLFSFASMEIPDSTTYFVQSLGKKGSPRVELVLNEHIFPALSNLLVKPLPVLTEQLKADSTSNPFLEKAEQRAKYDEDMRVVHLANVEVVARKIEKQKVQLPWYSQGSDISIDLETIEKRHASLVMHLVQNIPGVRVSGNGYIHIRGSKDNPLVLIDGIPMEWPDVLYSPYDSPLEAVNSSDIERIDVYKGPSASIFGVRGAHGAIAITTRRGGSGILDSQELNKLVLSPLGYQQPAEFYSPKYDTPKLRYTSGPDYRTTIFWKPDIVTDEDGKASFDFYSSDFSTTYSMILEGITADGKIVHAVKKIQVE